MDDERTVTNPKELWMDDPKDVGQWMTEGQTVGKGIENQAGKVRMDD